MVSPTPSPTALTEKGFVRGEIGNANPRDATVVRHAPGEQDNGNRVATELGGNPQVEEDANLTPGAVTVLLGDDYAGPGADGRSGSDSAAEDSGEETGQDGQRLGGTPRSASPAPRTGAPPRPNRPPADASTDVVPTCERSLSRHPFG